MDKSEKTLIVSFSGGRTSAYMSYLILNSEKYQEYKDIVFVFANTGKEKEETLKFINQCDKEFNLSVVWIEAKVIFENRKGTQYRIVDYNTASRKGEPFEDVIRKYGISNAAYPHCTRELKEVPIRKWARANFGTSYDMAIGIRIDEKQRLNLNRAKKQRWIYPLIHDYPTTKRHILEFWKEQPFDLQLEDYQGNCDLCWKKSTRKKLQILKENPSIGDWWERMEDEDGEYVFGRNHTSIKDYRAMIEANIQGDLFDGSMCSCFSNVQFD